MVESRDSSGRIGANAGLAVTVTLLAVVGCWRNPPAPVAEVASAKGEPCPVVIRKPAGPSAIPTGTFDEAGKPVSLGCEACHSTKPPDPAAKLGIPLGNFHQGLVGRHGNLSCHACHNPADGYATLRLADGSKVPHADVMTLCAQCHGPQFRDYQHGAHGGMTGHWDLTKGGRARNNCIDCHDPHAPKYPTVHPAPGPNDRFQPRGGHE